jgi:lysophospholipase L1-like esterase
LRNRFPVLFVLIALVPLWARAADPADFLPGVHRILFLGDSITQSGQYVDDIDTELRLRLPGRHFEIINCGLSSETVSGLSEAGHADGKFPRPDLHERLDRALAKLKPDLVFACYGMNDGIYLPLSDERFGRFKAGVIKLHDKVEASGAKIIHLTPPVFDPLPIKDRVAPADKVDAKHPFEGYGAVLDAYAQWLLEQRDKAGWRVIDVHGPMQAAIAQQRAANPAFTFARDGIHPNDAGHWVMAVAVLRGIGAPFDPDDRKFGEPEDPVSQFSKVYKLVRSRNRVMADAWLTDIGHKRPMKAGLPLEEAKKKAQSIDEQIAAAMPK